MAELPTEVPVRSWPRARPFGTTALVAVALGLGLGLALTNIAQRSVRVIGWFVAAMVAASLLAALIRTLERLLPHRAAVAASAMISALVIGTIVLRVGLELKSQLDRLQVTGPELARRVERSPRWGASARDFGLADRVKDLVDAIPGRLAGGSAADAARLAGTRGVAFVAGLVLTMFVCANGRRMLDGALSLVPQHIASGWGRAAVGEVIDRSARQAASAMLVAIAKALAVTLFVGVSWWIAGVPAPGVLGAFVGCATLVQGLGPTVIAAPLIGFAVGTVDGLRAVLAVSALMIAVVADIAVNRYLRRRRSVRVGPLLSLAAVLAGFELGGAGTAICMLGMVTMAVSLWSYLQARRRLMSGAATPEPPAEAVPARPAPTVHPVLTVLRNAARKYICLFKGIVYIFY